MLRLLTVVVAALQLSQTPILDGLLKEIQSLRQPAVSLSIAVPAGANLQAALDSAAPGSTLYLAQGEVFKVNLLMRNKAGVGTITLRTAGLDDVALPPTIRVTPATMVKAAKLICNDCFYPVIAADAGAHDYAFIGVEVMGNVPHPDRDLIQLGVNTATGKWYPSFAEQPLNIVFDRVYVHADATVGGHRGILADARNITVRKSDIRGFWEVGRDSQGIACFQGQGPMLFDDNYIEATGENFLCGGSDPNIIGAIPSDITFINNYVFKPLEWKLKRGTVKNLFELKNARRVIVKRNLFENVWADQQSGSAILFTVRNQDGGCPWCNVSQVDFSCNEVRNSPDDYAFNILATDNNHPSGTAEDINLYDNLVRTARGGMQVGQGAKTLWLTRNVFLGLTNAFLNFYGTPQVGLSVRDNWVTPGEYGIIGQATGPGMPSLTAFAPGAVFLGNNIEISPARFIVYPVGNTLVPTGSITAAARKCL